MRRRESGKGKIGHCPQCAEIFAVNIGGSLNGHGGLCMGRVLLPLGVLVHGLGTVAASRGCDCDACKPPQGRLRDAGRYPGSLP